VSRQGDQVRRLGELIFGSLTASRDELRELLTGDEEAIEEVRERGSEVIRDVGARAKRIVRADGRAAVAGDRRAASAHVLNPGQPRQAPPAAAAPSHPAEVVEGEDELARAARARPADGRRT
jgi:hypothetical protein